MVLSRAVLVAQAAYYVAAICPNACSRHGYCSNPDASLSDAVCICEPGFAGEACETAHCPRGDDPLTSNQNTRAITIQTLPANDAMVDGLFRFGFLGKSVTFPASGYDNDDATCGRMLSGLPGVTLATCERGAVGNRGETTIVVRFEEFASFPHDANDPHYGNPSLAAFSCASFSSMILLLSLVT